MVEGLTIATMAIILQTDKCIKSTLNLHDVLKYISIEKQKENYCGD